MPTARNMGELRAMLQKEMRKAMTVVADKAEADMHEETWDFYEGSKPSKYVRTGALGDTPRVTSLTTSGNQVSFEAYLDTSHRYATGDEPTMEQVLKLADHGDAWTTKGGSPARDTVGKKGFWDRAKSKMEQDMNDTLSSFFTKI